MLSSLMLGSLLVYGGAAIAAAGVLRKSRAATTAGLAFTAAGLLLPAREERVERAVTKLDEVMPAWHFNEVHSMHVEAPPEIVFGAVRNVRANEIAFFHALTWIRRGGRDLPESILNARDREPLLDVATRTGFEWLANDPPRELVAGTCLIGGGRAYGAVNFLITREGSGSRVTTETRVHAKDAAARRRFAAYWSIILPGSALIRLMWLRAVRERAVAAGALFEE